MSDVRFCPRCREPYRFYSMTVADQTYCPKCRAMIEKRIRENEKGVNEDELLPARDSLIIGMEEMSRYISFGWPWRSEPEQGRDRRSDHSFSFRCSWHKSRA